jgi:sulfide:quinone oxidoreductase
VARSVLILGGGFAGLEAAIFLRRQAFHVTLVSDRSFLFVYPTSIWVATGERRIEDVSVDLAALASTHGFTFVEGAVEAINGERREATVAGRTLSADYLVVAVGAAKMQPAGTAHTLSPCGPPSGSVDIERALSRLLDAGTGRIAVGFGGNPKDPSAVRGGPAFELIFNFDTLLRRRGLRDRFSLTFFAPMPVPGQRMGAKAVKAVEQLFARQGIQSRYGKKIAEFDAGGVRLEDGSRIDADLTVFIAAGDGHPVVKASDLPQNEAGFVRIDHTCAVPGRDGVFAVGDVAALEGPEWRAKQGHVAEVMARVAAANIASHAAGRPMDATYIEHVNIVCLMDTGNGAALVYRDDRTQRLVPLPIVGHWLKQAWAWYFKASKRRQVPRLPGM